MAAKPTRYKRILVKLSGEALMGNADYGIDPRRHQAHRRWRSSDAAGNGHRR